MSLTEPVPEPAASRAADELPARVEPLAYPPRMRELALHARNLAGTSTLNRLLTELFSRGRYERRVALSRSAIPVRSPLWAGGSSRSGGRGAGTGPGCSHWRGAIRNAALI